jgi:hypothetical protein
VGVRKDETEANLAVGDVAVGEVCLAAGEFRLAAGEVRLAVGEVRFAAGEIRLAAGEIRFVDGEIRTARDLESKASTTGCLETRDDFFFFFSRT